MGNEKQIAKVMAMINDVKCESCNWIGSSLIGLITFPKSNRELCPECGAPDSIIELDGVSEDDYRKQEGREKIR